MLMNIEAELYKVVHRRCSYVFLLLFGLGGFLFNIVFHISFSNEALVEGDAVMAIWLQIVLILGWFLVYMLVQIVYSNEGKIGVLKNSVGFGFSKIRLYIVRFLAQLIVMVAAVIIVSGAVSLGACVFCGAVSANIMIEFWKSILFMFPLWIAALSLANALSMCFNSNTVSTAIYILYFVLTSDIINMLLYFKPDNKIIQFLGENEIFCFVTNVYADNNMDSSVGHGLTIAAVYFIVSFTVGAYVFCNKEVK